MARSARLFRLLDLMRARAGVVTAEALGAELGVSERTIYRDIAELRAAGAVIDGEPGYGYRLTEDPALPPQNFDALELEAMVLGLAEVGQMGDPELAQAARMAAGKIIARLPERQQRRRLMRCLRLIRSANR